MGRTKLERETVIVFNDSEPDALVTTSSFSLIKKLERRGYVREKDWPGKGPENARFCVSKKKVSLRSIPREIGSETPRFRGGKRSKVGVSGRAADGS